jgi:hypothetical protein
MDIEGMREEAEEKEEEEEEEEEASREDPMQSPRKPVSFCTSN